MRVVIILDSDFLSLLVKLLEVPFAQFSETTGSDSFGDLDGLWLSYRIECKYSSCSIISVGDINLQVSDSGSKQGIETSSIFAAASESRSEASKHPKLFFVK